MVIAQKRTGRPWGDKKEPTTGKASIGGAKVEFEEFDHWDGPTEPGATGEYIRTTRLVNFGPIQWP